jgi:hypothetical protein
MCVSLRCRLYSLVNHVVGISVHLMFLPVSVTMSG